MVVGIFNKRTKGWCKMLNKLNTLSDINMYNTLIPMTNYM